MNRFWKRVRLWWLNRKARRHLRAEVRYWKAQQGEKLAFHETIEKRDALKNELGYDC